MANARIELQQLLLVPSRKSGKVLSIVNGVVKVRTKTGIICANLSGFSLEIGATVYIEDGNVIGKIADIQNVQIYSV